MCLVCITMLNLVQVCSQAGAAGPAPLSKTLSDLKDSCWRFLRPHTIRGTALGSMCGSSFPFILVKFEFSSFGANFAVLIQSISC